MGGVITGVLAGDADVEIGADTLDAAEGCTCWACVMVGFGISILELEAIALAFNPLALTPFGVAVEATVVTSGLPESCDFLGRPLPLVGVG